MIWTALTKVVGSAVPFQLTTDAPTKLLPLTVTVNVPPPAVALAGESELIAGTGLLIGNVQVPEVPPPGAGLVTVMFADPLAAISPAGTWAVTLVALTKVVASAVPFQFTTELSTKFVPFTVNVNGAVPARALTGASEVIVGTGFVAVMVNTMAEDEPPPLSGLATVILAVPAVVRSAVVIVALSSVAFTNPVVSAAPFQFTMEDAIKPVPVTVSVIDALPATMEAGEIDVTAG